MQTFPSLYLMVPALAGLAGDQSFIISDSVQRRDNGISDAMKQKQLAAVRLEFFEIGCVCVEPRSHCLIDRVHVTVEIES